MTLDLFATPPGGEREKEAAQAATVWSVDRLNKAVASLLARGMPPLWVAGEVSNLTHARSGHLYFSLKDESAQLRCVMWRDRAARLPALPEEGMEVRVFGRVGLYERRGDYQLTAETVEAEGAGLWRLAFERVRAALDADGLLDPARKRPLPAFPECVGVVTSGTGAALRDILHVVRRRAPWADVALSACRVQGEGAAEEIVCALERLYRWGRAEVIIAGRGGGSVEDLWAFNDERVARAITRSPVPVISAVGHETDISIADLVADFRAPTPSAGAECAVPDTGEVLRDLDRTAGRIDGALRRGMEARARRLEDRDRILGRAIDRSLGEAETRLRSAAGRIHALSPLRTLARGYAVPRAADGTVLRARADFRSGRTFQLTVRDGEVPCRVTDPGEGGVEE